ncbi:HEAT repeat domain-containing protein [Entomohabitans teleogrylli]|uniref:HEAT repeat domain-containing protein n=1 Tax=Entomohabitans teleogrylli TaxID=1384589 RepID=UPI00073D53F0
MLSHITEKLLELTYHSNPQIRIASLHALGESAKPLTHVVNRLIELTDDQSPDVAIAAIEALKSIYGKKGR